MSTAAEKLPPPEGTRAMMISMREMDTMGLKTGSGLRETVASRTFSKAEILQQISQVGFMCPFHEFRNEIAKLQGDDLLIVADPLEVYGENWLVCLTRKAYEVQMELLAQRERERLDELAAQAKAASGDNGDDDLASIVYEDRPMLARAWVSSSTKETRDEVDALSIVSNRPLIKLSLTKMSDEFNADCKFSDRDADQCFVEWRQHKDPNYELTRLEQDIGLQGIPELVDNSTQTSWFRSINSALQYEPIVMDAAQRQREMDSEAMHAFLERMLPLVEQALQQNETLDIFRDPFAELNEEDPTLSNKSENAIKELRSFTDLVYSKNKTLPAIDWHPKKNGVVAVAAAASVNFARRLDLLDKVDSSFILIWNFVDLIHPQLMLEAPQDVLTLRFNPTQPHIIAGGLYNGQVLVWDFSKAEHVISKGKTAKSASSSSSSSSTSASSSKASMHHDESPKQLPPVKPTYVSYIDASHRRPVADLLWLPAGMEVNNRGHLVPATDMNINQFVTIAGDGQVSFWDLRFKDPKYRGITRTKVDKSAAKDAPPEVHFIPIYSIALTKVESSGELGLKCFRFERQKEDSGGAGQLFSSRFYCGTEEGEFVYADWRPHAAATKAPGDAGSRGAAARDDDESGGSGGGGDGVEYVQWICRDHFRPIIGLCPSPFFPSIFVTASESTFHIWNVSQHKASDANGPILLSPLSLATITCVAFSPTRPGVLFVGKSDGVLEVWDFMDQSHRASLTVGVTACALTSIEFRPVVTAATGASGGASGSAAGGTATANAAGKSAALGKTSGGAGGSGANNSGSGQQGAGAASASLHVKQQLVAIGDQIGNLHIMEIPRTLSRATSGERQAMEAYFTRESERMKAVRSSGSAATGQQLSTRIMQGGSARDDNSSGNNNNGNAYSANSGAAPGGVSTAKAASSDTAGAGAAVAGSSASVVDDEVFKRMEAEFCRELGVDTAAA